MSAPTIVGGLSTFSSSVRLQGQVPGAFVIVFQNGSPIVQRTSTSSDEVFEFDLGVVLGDGDEITAQQKIDGYQSQPSAVPTRVQRRIPPYTGHRFVSHLYRCGTSLFISGIVPGAEIHVGVIGQTRGKSRSVDGSAVVVLSEGTVDQQSLRAWQVVGGVVGPDVWSPRADPPPSLDAIMLDPLLDCQRTVIVQGAVDGATVAVQLDAGDPSSESTFSVPIPTFRINVPDLVEGQKLLVTQQMRSCEIEGGASEHVVGLAAFAFAPEVALPLCAGSVLLAISRTVPDATLTARQGGKVVGVMTANGTDDQMWIDPLDTSGAPVIVTQKLCNVSIDSVPAAVTSMPANVGPVQVMEPLVDCGMSVWIDDAMRGGIVIAYSDQIGPISAPMRVSDPLERIDLHTPLVQGHTIWVEQSVCGGAMKRSSNEPVVQSVPELTAPTLEDPAFADRSTVRAIGAQPGATVELYEANDGFIGSAIADWSGEAHLPTSSPARNLSRGDFVRVRQLLCAQVSPFSEPDVEVTDRRPGWYANLSQLGTSGIFSSDTPTVVNGVFTFENDNPALFTILPLKEEYAEWAGTSVPQEVQSAGLQWTTHNCKISTMPALPAPVRGTDLEAVEVFPENDGSWASPDVVPVRMDGIRLGYLPSTLSVIVSQPFEGRLSSRITTPSIALASATLLVPVDVVYFFHDPAIDNQPPVAKSPAASESAIRALFDRLPEIDPNGTFTSTWPPGEIKTRQRRWLTTPITGDTDRYNRRTPDSVFAVAGVAFRVMRYVQQGVERKLTLPRAGEFQDDHSPFKLNRNNWPANGPLGLRVLIMGRLVPVESPIDGVGGPGIVGLSALSAFDSLAHEIGHAAGLGHSPNPTNLMNEFSGNGYDLTAEQITKVRIWAAMFQSSWT